MFGLLYNIFLMNIIPLILTLVKKCVCVEVVEVSTDRQTDRMGGRKKACECRWTEGRVSNLWMTLSCRLGHAGSTHFFLALVFGTVSKLPPPQFFVNTDIWQKTTCLHPSVAEGNRRHSFGLGTTLLPKGSQFKGSSLSVTLLSFPV